MSGETSPELTAEDSASPRPRSFPPAAAKARPNTDPVPPPDRDVQSSYFGGVPGGADGTVARRTSASADTAHAASGTTCRARERRSLKCVDTLGSSRDREEIRA